MSTVDYRPASAGDVEAILALWAVAAENDDRPADTRADLQRLIARDPLALLLAQVQRDVAPLAAALDTVVEHLELLGAPAPAAPQG